MTPSPGEPPAQPPEGGQGRQLMERVRDGDRDAFAELYRLEAPRLFGVLLHLCGTRQRAEDALQEVFLKAWRAAPRWRPDAPVGAWLLAIARRASWNASAFRRRRRALRRTGLAVDVHAADPEASPAPDALARADDVAEVRAALARLSPPLRFVFVLVRLHGSSLAEAADAAGIPVGTVKSRLAAAEAKLRTWIASSDRTSPRHRGSRG
ncbi:MAG: RNA polymerase sigma factor [Planctomycetota bacterium]